jgi:hypothetical protein
MKTHSLLIGVLILSLVGIVGVNAQVSVELTIENQQVVGTDFFFDVVLTRLGTNDVYLGTADFVLTFNAGNFTNPVLSKSTNAYNLMSTNSVSVGTMYRTATSAATITGNELILNLQQVLFGDQDEFNDNIARITNTVSVHRMGRFRISGITNAGGTIGLHWKTSGTGVTTKVFTLATTSPWASAPTTVLATDPTETPLPITLAAFTAQVLPGGFRVKLDWTTLTEINNYGFYVQRRRDTDSLFVDVPNSFIPGHGTTTEPHHYSYTDTTATRALWSYRLKQIDLDGTIHYSAAITVDLTTAVEEPQLPTVFSLHQNYPNPFNPSTTIRYDLPVAAHVTLKLYDIVGREAQVLVDGIQEPGYKSVQFDASTLASGVYLYRLQAGTFIETRKMLVIK